MSVIECLGGLESLPCEEPAKYEARALCEVEEGIDPEMIAYWPICEAHAAYWRESGCWQVKTPPGSDRRERRA